MTKNWYRVTLATERPPTNRTCHCYVRSGVIYEVDDLALDHGPFDHGIVSARTMRQDLDNREIAERVRDDIHPSMAILETGDVITPETFEPKDGLGQ